MHHHPIYSGAALAYSRAPAADPHRVMQAVAAWNRTKAADHRRRRHPADEVRCLLNATECDTVAAEMMAADMRPQREV